MFCHILFAVLALQGPIVQPPMHRAWTLATGENTEVLGVRSGVAVFISRNRVGAVTLADGKPRWVSTHEDWTQRGILAGTEIFTVTSGRKEGRLLAHDLATGRERTIRPVPEGAREIAWHGGRLFLLTAAREIVAIDPPTGATVWKLGLGAPDPKGRPLDEMTLCGDVLLCALDDEGWVGVDPAARKVLWTMKAQYANLERPKAVPGGVLLGHPQTTLVEPRTGRPKWTRPDLDLEFFGVAGSVLVGESDDQIVVVDLATGRTLHALPGGSSGFTYAGGRTDWLGSADGVLAAHDEVRFVAADGRVLWSSAPFFSGWPAFAEPGRLLTSDGDRLLCYVPGERPPLPTGRAERDALARRWASDFESLDDLEREAYATLGDVAAEALIGRCVEWAKESERQWGRSDDEDDLGMLRYSLLEAAWELLDRMCGPEQTEALSRAVEAMGSGSGYRSNFVGLLGRHGRQDVVMRAYVSELREGLKSPPSRRGDLTMVQMVARSKDPQAVRFMIEVLADPKAPREWRKEAFVHLAGTGGEAGAAAVLAARDGRRPRMRWEDRIDLAGMAKRSVVAEAKDSQGVLWRLFHSAALGNGSDLFIASKGPSGWSRPVFTGVFTEKTWNLPAPTAVRGIPIAEVLAAAWIRLFPGDASLGKDSDGDGLTDLVERRFGTDPAKADTDSDGLADAVDPCPNAAPRPLGDKEKILAACVEARFYLEDWGSPAVIEVEGVTPFEMYGYRRPLLWQTGGYRGDLPKMYGTGVNTLGFHASTTEGRQDAPMLSMSADGRSATIAIRRYSGGLNGDGIAATLIKVGDEWYVTELRGMYVS